MSKNQKIGLCVVAIVILLVIGYFVSPGVRRVFNEERAAVLMADDSSRYETKKKVEDTCRAMLASYEADKLTWQQYRDSESEEKREWADQAMIRANRTAATYNTYILENGYVWSGNVPKDIDEKLPYLNRE